MKIITRHTLTCVLLAAVGSLVWLVQARPLAASASLRTGCIVNAPRLIHTMVSATGGCYRNGKHMGTVFTHGYSELDFGGATCSTVSGKPGASFAPQPLGGYVVEGTITARPASSGSALRPYTRHFKLTEGNRLLVCGKLDRSNPPTPALVCGYQFDVPNSLGPDSVCGELERWYYPSLGGQPEPWSGPLPMWDTKPMLVGRVMTSPHFVSPWGACRSTSQISTSRGLTWMGQPISSGYYVCANKGGVVPLVSLFYYAPGATNVATCTFDDHNLILGGEYTSFTLPPDWTQWGGTLDVVWKLVSVDPKTGLFISYMFADEAFQLSGANNACAELATHSSG